MAIFRLQAAVLLFLSIFMFCSSQQYIGVTYGTQGSNMPTVADVAKFVINSTCVQKVRLFDIDTGVIKTLAAANIDMVVGFSDNSLVMKLLENPSMANDWAKMLIPWADKIDILVFGNQVMDASNDRYTIRNLVIAMDFMQNALKGANLRKIKVSTVNSINVLRRQDPPSNASFKSEYYGSMQMLLKFLRENKSPYMTTAHPFYAYQSNPTPDMLSYCLFQKNVGRVDPLTGLKYSNMFDEQVDAVRNALDGFQYPDIEIVVAETGWPTRGDDMEVGASENNARIYLENLVHHIRSKRGTPMMPNRILTTYIHSLLDENLKNGSVSNQAFGIAKYDLTWKYSSVLSKNVSSKS